MSLKLNEAAINKAAREVTTSKVRRDLSDAGCSGLRLRLTPAGGKSWVLACRDGFNRMRRFPLETYPTLSISEARDNPRALHVKLKDEGADP